MAEAINDFYFESPYDGQVSSKSASRRRRQAANKKKYAQLRKAGRLPQHTMAERRHAAAERVLKHETDQKHHQRLQRVAVPTAVTAAAAAVLVFGAPRLTGHLQHNSAYPVATQPFGYGLPYADHPDPPHQPEPDATFYPQMVVSGTAVTAVAPRPTSSKPWNPWLWVSPY